MTVFIFWYLIVSLLGWITFPLAHRLFPALADRGYTLSRAAGLLVWGYIFWLLASLGIAQNDIGGILLALAFIIGLSIWSVVNRKSETSAPHASVIDFLRSNLSLILTTEILFFIAFAFLAFVRSANPELNGTERPMELAFINAILRSPTFPPQDPWLSGYAISYYYFGYVMTAMLARITGITGSMAHNLMTSLVFGLGAIGAYGILYNLLSRTNREQQGDSRLPSPALSALLAPLFLLLIGNFGALLEVLHQRGFLWGKDAVSGAYTSRFWTWLDMKELSQPQTVTFSWPPLERYLWWWRSSRVLQDYDMLSRPLEVIDEFPSFSFLLGDLHPHVLAIPFGLLAVAVAMNLFFGGLRGEIQVFGAKLRVNFAGFLFSALVLGGLAFLNTWDILIGAALIVASYVIWRANEDGWSLARLEDTLLFALPLGILAILLYLPFYLGFSSQAGGVMPNFMYVTRGAHLWVMWGTLLIPILAYLAYLWRGEKIPSNWKLGFSLGIGFTLLLLFLTFLTGWLGTIVEKDFVAGFLSGQGLTAGQFVAATTLRRINHGGSLITLLAVLIPSLTFLFQNSSIADDEHQAGEAAPSIPPSDFRSSPHQFILLILALGAVLILVPDFVYLRDNFGYRINTVFKFYYQAWMLWSLSAAFGIIILLQNLRGALNVLFRVLIGLVIFCGLLFPVLGFMTKTNNFKPYAGFTLDDFERIRRENPDEAAAIEFLQTVPNGVIAEAVGDSYQSEYARISTYTGLQSVLGWVSHEGQWRGSSEPQGSRREDITTLYVTIHWEEAQPIIEKYNIRYIFIGNIERTSMPVSEGKFQSHLKAVFQQGNTVIYEVP